MAQNSCFGPRKTQQVHPYGTTTRLMSDALCSICTYYKKKHLIVIKYNNLILKIKRISVPTITLNNN